jgi:hypothetical protein
MDINWTSKRGATTMIDFRGSFVEFFRTRRGPVLLSLLAVVFLLNPVFAGAQELSATLSGVVTDATGAVIPHASVAIAQNGVNAGARSVETDGSGNYVVTNLTAGTYSVTITAVGFETFKGKNIVLNVAEKHTFNAQLKAGSTSTTITVDDNPVQVDTETSGQAGTISGTQIRELEVASRSFAQLVTLQPGVVNAGLGDEAAPQANDWMTVNGARASSNNWTVDGADINDSGSNQTINSLPSIDAIQEFTLQRGNYDAGYGRSGGGQVLVQTKSGTSAIHGDLFEFVRNTDFNANEWFTKQSEILNNAPNVPSPYHKNVYGFTVGGPVYIPRVYNTDKKKTFFFYSEEWTKWIEAGSTISLPAATPDMVAGKFVGVYTAPSWLSAAAQATENACLTYAGTGSAETTTINPSCWSANAKVYNTNILAANEANDGPNYVYAASTQNNKRDDIIRIDHYFNDKVHFYARGMRDVIPVVDPGGMSWGSGLNYPGVANTMVNNPGYNVVGNLTWTISPKAVNEFEFAYGQGTITAAYTSGQLAESSTLNSALTAGTAYFPEAHGRVPAVYIYGAGAFPGINVLNADYAPYGERNMSRTYFDNFSYSAGKHTIRAGFQFEQMLKTENASSGGPPTWGAPGPIPVYAFSTMPDFLLGNVSQFWQTKYDVTPDLHFVNSEAYVQDDFKFNHKLTINMGIRWSFLPSTTDVNNKMDNFDPQYFTPADAPLITAGLSGGTFASTTVTSPLNYANGLIFPQGANCINAQLAGKYASCSPYGAYVNPNRKANFAPRVGFAYNPDGQGKTSIRGGFGLFYDRTKDAIWENNAFSNPLATPSVTILHGSFDAIAGGSAAVPTGPASIVATGNPTYRIPTYANFNLTVERQLAPTSVLSVAYVSNEGRHLLGAFDMNQPSVGAWEGQTGGPGANELNYIRPYAGFSTITSHATIFTSNYNALQASLNHRTNNGMTVGVAYTWAKNLTTNVSDSQSTTDTYNMKLDYGPTSYDQRQTLMVSYVYVLPFYKSQNGAQGKLLGGWEVSGITSATTGQPFNVTQAVGNFDPLNNGSGIGAGSRPDQVVKHIPMPKQVNEWFDNDTSANGPFQPAYGHFGSESSDSIYGPGLQNWDMAAIKNTKIVGNVSFQLRAEFFNAFNHENFNNPDAGMADGSYGMITGGHAPRRIQFGSKLYF